MVDVGGDGADGSGRPRGRDVDELAAALTAGVPGARPWWAGPAETGVNHVAAAVSTLTAVIGTSDEGAAVSVDMMAAALGGAGPHGMVLGGPGTGKSDLLGVVALSLAATYPPSVVQLLLIGARDVSPGDPLAGLGALPHVTVAGRDLPTDGQRGAALLDEVTQWISTDSAARRRDLRPVHPARRPRRGPHLVVVIDDYHRLEADPQTGARWQELVWRVVSRGPTLNQHLLVAGAALSPGLRILLPHTGFRIVVGADDPDAPADFTAAGPAGRALLAVGEEPPAAVEVLCPSAQGRRELIERIVHAG